jgi:hypothetical protein
MADDASHANRLMDMAFEDGEVQGPLFARPDVGASSQR